MDDATKILDDDLTEAFERRAAAEATDLDDLYKGLHRGSLVSRPGDVGTDYINFALNPEGRVPLGWEWIDAVLKGGIAPGEVAVLGAASSSGKTALMANVCVNNPHIPILFASIELPLIMVAARLFAMLEGETFATLEERIKAGADNLQARIARTLHEQLPHLGLMGMGSPTVETFGKAVVEYEEHWGQRPKLLMVDYLDLMSPNSENVEAVKRKFVDLRAFAKGEDLGSLIAHQLKREVMEGRHGEPIRYTDMRYAGETEADHVLGLYRRINDRAVQASPELYAEYSWTCHVQCLKTRSGPITDHGGHELGFNPETLRITDRVNGLVPIRTLGQAGRVLSTPQEELFNVHSA